MPKIRSDSLYAKLTPEQRDTLLEWLVIEAVSYQVAADRMTEFWGVEVSIGAVCAFFSRHGFAWRLEQAKAKANDKATSLPKDFEAKKKAALAQREFEAVFQDLTTKEIIALRQLENDERIVRLKEKIEPRKLAIAERRVKLLEDREAKVKATLADPAATSAEKESRMREIFGL